MSEVNTGGSAFPWIEEDSDALKWSHRGMTLRDYFAAKALPVVVDMAHKGGLHAEGTPGEWDFDNAARWSYEMADAMLAAREVKQ